MGTSNVTLGALLGTQPKYSDGSISSLYGIDDDPRIIQINVPIQPGNSGGLLLTTEGKVVGIVVSALNAKYFIEEMGILPQNVNFAVKADYLVTLMATVGISPMVAPKTKPKTTAELIQRAKIFTLTVQNWQ